MGKKKLIKYLLTFTFLISFYHYIQFLKVKRIEDYSEILFKASSQKDKAFSILIGDYIERNKEKYSWSQYGEMEEYFLYLELHPNHPDFKKIKSLLIINEDNSFPDQVINP